MSPKLANYGWPASAALLALAAGLLLLFVVPDSNEQRKVSPTASAKVSEICGKLPLAFESNHGQAANQVKFLTRGPEYHLFLTPSEAVLTLHSKRPLSDKPASPILSKRSDAEIPQAIAKILRMQFIGANANPKIIGENELPGKVNYFIGNNPSQWQTDIPTYARVRYPRMYPGVDLVYYGDGRRLEFDFEVHPDGRADAVKLRLVGATGLETDASGDLIIGIESAQLRMKKPIVYQMNNGVREEIQAAYLLEGDLLTFQIAGYDTTRPLIIDPILVYSRILGGSGDDNGVGIAIDGAGAAYLAGQTNSGNYPISGPFQGTYRGNADAFVTKLNPAGSAVEYSTFLGGIGMDFGCAIEVDGAGAAYVTGWTGSSNFPVRNAIQDRYAGGESDVFLAKLSPSGSDLAYSTYIGGRGEETCCAIAIDSLRSIYLTGDTNSTNFPTRNPFQTAFKGGDLDAFATRVNPAGSELSYSTYLGGSGLDSGSEIAVDQDGFIYVLGDTKSADFPVRNPFQARIGGNRDGFVSKLNPDNASLIYSTYLGGYSDEYSTGLAVDSTGAAYATGSTSSRDFPIRNAFQSTFSGGIQDVFAAKLNPSGTALVYSTYLGGTGKDSGYDLVVNSLGAAYVTGYTNSSDFPVRNPIQQRLATDPAGNGLDAFVTKFNPEGSTLAYSTYLDVGGPGWDEAPELVIDNKGNVYVGGRTRRYLSASYSDLDAFAVKISDGETTTSTTTTLLLAGTPRGILDEPQDNATLTGIVLIQGWAAVVVGNRASITTKVELLIGGVPRGELQRGMQRPDVQQFFAGQGISAPGNLGFSGTWNSRAVPDGAHRLSIRAADAAGSGFELVTEIAAINVRIDNGNPPTTTTTSTTIVTTTTGSASTTTATSSTSTTMAAVYRRTFPKVHFNDPTMATGVAVLNLAPSAAPVQFKAYANNGTLLATALRSIAPLTQLAQQVSELFGTLTGGTGWVAMESSVPDIEGMFLLYDNEVTTMDGAGVINGPYHNFVFPVAERAEVSLVNPSSATVSYSLAYISDGGLTVGSFQGTIPADGRTVVMADPLRPQGSSGGYIRGSSDGVVAFETFGNSNWLAALEASDAAAGASASLQYAPQFVAGNGYLSALDLVNLEAQPLPLNLTFINDLGQNLGQPTAITLPASGSMHLVGPAVFGLTAGQELIQGYVRIQSTSGRFAGSVRFTDPGQTSFGSALNLVSTGKTTAFFSQVAQDARYYTGLAAVNPTPRSATVSVTVYGTDGRTMASGRIQISAAGRFSRLLPELVGALPSMSRGFFQVASNEPIICFALFGTHDGKVLAAIPAQSP